MYPRMEFVSCKIIILKYLVPGQVDLPPEVGEDNITATSALIQWSPPVDPNGVIIGYRVSYEVISSDPGMQSRVLTECIIGGDIHRNISVGDVTMVLLTGLSE